MEISIYLTLFRAIPRLCRLVPRDPHDSLSHGRAPFMHAATVDLLVQKAHLEPDTALAIATAIDMALDNAQLVTVAILDARFAASESKTDARFTAMESKTDAQFTAMESRMDARFAA